MEDIHYVKYAADAARRSGLSQTEDSQPEASKGSCAIGRAGNTKGKGKSGGGWQHEVSNGARVCDPSIFFSRVALVLCYEERGRPVPIAGSPRCGTDR